MRRSLLPLLCDPVSGDPFVLEEHETEDGDVRSGILRSAENAYEITRSIPRFLASDDAGQRQTETVFGYKWSNVAAFGSPGMRRSLGDWMVERYGFGSRAEMRNFFGSRGRVLDAGCGAGLATEAWMDETWANGDSLFVGVDISAAIDIAREKIGSYPCTHFAQADILRLPFVEEAFDAIFVEGVLHHTPSTQKAFEAIVPLLAPGGELMFYVYRLKAPVRECTDDHVRGLLGELPPEQAWALMRPLTKLAQALAELKVEVDVPEDVPLLGIEAGRYDVQRLLYWHFAKLYWNPELTFEENTHVNFDWYAPHHAHRHTAEEVRGWCGGAGLEIVHFDERESGFTVRAVRGRSTS